MCDVIVLRPDTDKQAHRCADTRICAHARTRSRTRSNRGGLSRAHTDTLIDVTDQSRVQYPLTADNIAWSSEIGNKCKNPVSFA